ncbi:MAG: DUF4097 domain-containing protein [Erysipelotrichaceae bacterium]|nr:DUF4097 domain-containing protein [Erysipelotrichaceae bacterium]
MKHFKLLSLLLAIPFLCGCYNSAGGGTYADADKYLVGSQTYVSSIDSIDIDWAFGKVTLISDESITGAIVKEENNLIDDEKVHSYLKGSELLIKFFASGHRGNNIDSKDKELYLTYNPNDIKIFDIGSTSATVVLPKLVASEEVKLSLTSGNVSVEGINSPKTDIYLSSGYVKINELTSNNLSIKATSGTVDIKNIHVGDIDADMTSGNLSLGFVEFNKGQLDMTSGEANITLPDDGAIVSIHKTSGTVITSRECTISGDQYVFGTSEAKMDINITSGKVVIS